MYGAPPELPTAIHATLPDQLRNTDKQSDWTEERRVPRVHSFLEGPSFDRAGSLSGEAASLLRSERRRMTWALPPCEPQAP